MALTAEGKALTAVHHKGQAAIAGKVALDVEALVREMLDPDGILESAPAFILRALDAVADGYLASQNVAETYLARFRAAELGVQTASRLEVAGRGLMDLDDVSRTLWSIPQHAQHLVGQGVDPLAAIRTAADHSAGKVAKDVVTGGRTLLTASAEANHHGWRRVASARACAFCAMLAGRGPVYKSGTAQLTKKGTLYHAHCLCSIEEVHGEWIPTEQERKWRDVYDRAADGSKNLSEALANMRQQGGFSDSPVEKRHVGASGGGVILPPRGGGGGSRGGGAGPFKPMGDPPDPEDKRAYAAYWFERQSAIPVNFSGDTLKPHEVMAVERLIRRGEEIIEWIPAHPWLPRNDFLWGRTGKPVELKSTGVNPDRICGRIEDATIGSHRHLDNGGHLKDSFLIDIGYEPLVDEIVNALSKYNVGRRKYRVADIWVMSSDGAELHQIRLEA